MLMTMTAKYKILVFKFFMISPLITIISAEYNRAKKLFRHGNVAVAAFFRTAVRSSLQIKETGDTMSPVFILGRLFFLHMISVNARQHIGYQKNDGNIPIHRLGVKIAELPCAVTAIRCDDAGDNFED